MGKLDKLIAEILKLDKKLRFEELSKVLVGLGYKCSQPQGGSSHYIFRMLGKNPISVRKNYPMDIAYVKKVRDALIKEGFVDE